MAAESGPSVEKSVTFRRKYTGWSPGHVHPAGARGRPFAATPGPARFGNQNANLREHRLTSTFPTRRRLTPMELRCCNLILILWFGAVQVAGDHNP